jgi:pimeloyl-ACP methyl ester carboxylesterase
VGTVRVVGHSLGAVIGMYLAAIAPQRIAGLALVDAGGNIPEDTAQGIAASVARLGTVYPSLDAYLGLMRQLPMFEWSDYWDEWFRYDAEVREDGTVVSRVPKAAIDEEMLALTLARTETLPDLVKCPTLIARATVGLLGPDRGLVLPREEAERLRGIIARSRIVEVANTNHYTIISDPALLDEVATFFAAETA